MAIPDEAVRLETLAKLAQTRAEIRRVLDPPPRQPHVSQGGHGEASESYAEVRTGTFPRSRTMRLLVSGRGIGTAGAVIGGLILARPALAFKLLRMFPTGAVARMAVVKAITVFRSRR